MMSSEKVLKKEVGVGILHQKYVAGSKSYLSIYMALSYTFILSYLYNKSHDIMTESFFMCF